MATKNEQLAHQIEKDPKQGTPDHKGYKDNVPPAQPQAPREDKSPFTLR